MALFSRAKKTEEKVSEKKEKTTPIKEASSKNLSSHSAGVAGMILGPRITEKATDAAQRNVFVFNVRQDATKERIAAAIKESYKVTPRKINIVTMKPKRVISARRRGAGFTAGGKKAYVYLKEGDKIEFA